MILRIKKTLVGAGGIKLIQHPGLVFPSSALKASTQGPPPQHEKHCPEWGISTKDAMKLLHCSASSVRQRLHSQKVKFIRVRRHSSPPTIYWDRKALEKIIHSEVPFATETPKNCVNTQEACQMLGLARSALHRYAKKGKLHAKIVRCRSRCGFRTRHFYLKNDIETLTQHLKTMRKRG